MQNVSFELGVWHKTYSGIEYDNIFVPELWTAWWKEDSPYGRIEMQVISKVAPFLNPPRIYEYNKALKFFTMWRIHDAGVLQTIATIPGVKYRVRFFAHAWSNQDDDPHTSEGATGAFSTLEGTPGLTDAQRNFTFRVGVDLSGAANPFATTIQWGQGIHIYNVYAEVPALEFVATGTSATVFLRSTVLWPFKHCDAYLDAVTLEVVETPPPVECRGLPRVQYERTYHVWPPWATPEERRAVAEYCADNQKTSGPSFDDAGLGDLDYRYAVLHYIPAARHAEFETWFAQWYPDVEVSFADTPDVPPEPPLPPSGLYIPYGTKLSIHAINPGGTPEHASALTQAGAPLAVFKAVDDWGYLHIVKATSPSTLTIARRVMPFDGAGEVQNWTQVQIEAAAASYMAQYRAILTEQAQYDNGQRLQHIDWLELLNEADPPGAQGYRNLALLMIAMLNIGETWDLPVKKFACFGMNAGTPEWDEMLAVADTGLLERIAHGGHILALHEGVLPFSDPIDKYWPGTIPGAPYVERAGALCGRYRYWLHIAQQRGLYVPIVISEFYGGYGDAFTGSQIVERLAWYDNLAKDDPEVLAFLPFTNGPTPQWMGQNYDPFLPNLREYAISVKDRQNAIPSGEPQPPPIPPEPPGVIAYSQRDPLWAAKRLLPSYATMGGSGCLVTSIAIKATEYDQSVTPGNLCDCLCSVGGFNTTGGLLFYKIDDCLPWMLFRGYTLWSDTANMAAIETALSRGSIIIKVDFYPSTELIDSHFVYVVGWTDAAHTDLAIIDPWTGERTTLMTKYARATLAKSIKGLVDYEIVPIASTETLIGFNDCDGPNGSASQWMMER